MRITPSALVLASVALVLGCDRTCADLHDAAARDDVARLEQLASSGADPACVDGEGWAPIHAAARSGHTRALEWLLAHGADLEARGHRGRSPLYEAAKYGQLDATRLLLDRGAAVDARTDELFTPLIVASERRQRDVMVLLLDRGADVNAANAYGKTPLMQLLEFLRGLDDPTLVQLLVERGAWLDVHDSEGWTPLHVAARHGYPRVATVLLDAGANPDAVHSSRAYLPINHARSGGHQPLVDLLETRMRWRQLDHRTARLPRSVTRSGVVVHVSGPRAPAIGERCEVTLRPYDGGARFNCQLEAHCGARRIYGSASTGFLLCEETAEGWRAFDARGTPDDGDPAALIELAAGWFFADDGLAAPTGTSVQVRLDPEATGAPD